MTLTLRPMKPEEEPYTYTKSMPCAEKTGYIGHLSGHFVSGGSEFQSTFHHKNSLDKTPEFMSELDQLIRTLRLDPRFGCLLCDFETLHLYCRKHATKLRYLFSYGLRADTEKHAYLLRLTPTPGHNHVYIYCFKRDVLEKNFVRRKENTD